MNLPAYIHRHLELPFQYGTNDCMTFVVGWLEIATGSKYLPEKLWKNEDEATMELMTVGGMEAAFDEHFTRIVPSYANDGDITVVSGIAHLFSGSYIVSVGKEGLKFRSRSLANIAWSTHGRRN